MLVWNVTRLHPLTRGGGGGGGWETRDLTKPRRRRQRERQKTIGLMSKTTTLHAFLYISLPSLHN